MTQYSHFRQGYYRKTGNKIKKTYLLDLYLFYITLLIRNYIIRHKHTNIYINFKRRSSKPSVSIR